MLKQRLMTAMILLISGIGILALTPITEFIIPASVLLGLMAWEWARLTGWTTPLYASGYAVSAVSLLWMVFALIPDVMTSYLWQILTIWLTLGVILAVVRYQQAASWSAHWAVMLRVFGLLWLLNFALAFTVLPLLVGVPWLIYAMSLVWVMDSFAYFAGKRFGQHRLASNVSPGKTWEGVAGGLFAVALYALSVAIWQDQSVAIFMLIAVVVAGLSVVGDLFESALKRQAGVKDSSQMLPGHGGWLDRFDALLLALPVYLLCYQWWLA
jgi:phosphatidate cytidylyltransferase